MALPDMIVRIGLDSGEFLSQMNAVKKEIGSVSGALSGVTKVGQSLQDLGTSFSAGLTLPLAAFGVAAVDARSKIEQIEMGLRAVSGGAEDAARMLAIVKEAARLPGLTFEAAAQGAINLRAVGFSAEQTQRILTAFGNALAVVGRGGEDLNAVIIQLTQMASKSKIVAGDLKPILERVPQAVNIIKQAFGTIDTEELQKKKISAQDFIEVILAGLEKLPPAASTTRNEFDNARDAITLAMADIGTSIAPVAVTIAQTLVPAVQTLAAAFTSLPMPVQQGAAVFGLFLAAIGPVLLGAGQLLLSLKTLAAGAVALQGALAASAGFTAFVAALKGMAIAAAAAAAPFALLALKIAAVAAIVGGAVYGLAKLGQWLFGAGSNADWLAKKIESAFGSLKKFVTGSDKAQQSSAKMSTATDKAADSVEKATRAALEHAQAAVQHEKALEEQEKAAKKAAKEQEKLAKAYIASRTEALQSDITFRALVLSLEGVGDKYQKARNFIIEYKARLLEGKDTTWAMNEACKSFDKTMQKVNQTLDASKIKMNDISKAQIPDLVSAVPQMTKAADDVKQAWQTLGLPSPSETEQKKKDAVAAYEAIKNSGTASADEIKAAYEAMQKAVAGEDGVSGKIQSSIQQVSTAISESARNAVGILIGVKQGSVMDALGELGAGVMTALVEPWLSAFEDLIERGVKKLIGWLISETGLSGAISAVGKMIGGIFGGAASSAGGAAAGAAGGAAGGAAAGAAGSAVGGAATGAIGAMAGWGSALLSGGIAALGSIAGSMIGAAMMGGDLGKIEENTRFTQIGIIGEKGVIDLEWGIIERLWEQRDLLMDVGSKLGWAWEMMSQAWPLQLDRLAEIRDRIVDLPDRMRPLSITVQGNVIGNEEYLEFLTREIGKRLAAQGA